MTKPFRPALRILPLIAIVVFLTVTILFYFWGPIAWPSKNPGTVALFLITTLLVMSIGFTIGVSGSAVKRELSNWRWIYVIGAVSACAMLFPSAYIYTGKMPWQIFEAMADQSRAYSELQERLVETEGTRGPIVLARTLTYWMIYAVIPLAVWHWGKLSQLMRLLMLGTVLSTAAFSILRGTDREIIDLGILTAAAAVIGVTRFCVVSGQPILSMLRSPRAMAAILGGAVVLVVGFNLFIERKSQRLSDPVIVCVGVSGICADPKHPVMQVLSPDGQFALGMFTAYVAQGYYGLSLALDREFVSTYGIGHSPAVARLYEAATKDDALYERSFTFRLRAHEWSDRHHWATLFTWIANDVGFFVTIPVMGLLAWLWGRSWLDTVLGGDDAAAIVFCMLTQLFVYIPANNQLANVTEAYAAIIVWLAIWLRPGRCQSSAAAEQASYRTGQ